ncbi:hypothetical protein KKE19_03415 [Patescibacteria group bacterium]|nr:hypothetical protein [Patescibacteria group bacterium]MBU4367805.1 hypothetical protein [Patescibacteria group bacterium]MBU4462183.1 hypothetical protein [Patescibacteria group bacterium]MCG2699944.1 hypothetical protein [Candidatus Parcubacteria bacterium]
MEDKKEENKIDEELKKIVIARLEVFPSDKKISIGSAGEFTKQEMIENIEKGTDVGEKIIEVELNYLQNLKEGIFYEQDFADNET